MPDEIEGTAGEEQNDFYATLVDGGLAPQISGDSGVSDFAYPDQVVYED